MKNLIFVVLGLTILVNCFSQDSIVTYKKDAEIIKAAIKIYDIDLKINDADMALDSSYSVHEFKNPTIKTDLKKHTEKIKEYLWNLINEGGFDKKSDISSTDQIYDFKFKHSSLSKELEKYIQSINDLNLNATVKRIAINKVQKIKDYKTVDAYRHKYNTPLTVLKIQLYKVIWSEIYIIDNENVKP